MDELTPLADLGTKYREDVIEVALKSGVRDQGNEFKEDTFKKMFATLSIEEIKEMGEAWEVVRKFPDVHMEHSERNDFAMIGDNFDTAVTCETMPLAICRAALLAMVTA